ncbi:MAG: hypothetical protein IIB71_13920 [Proteobacteria bacterium]|nr:hypothetical protein [Pseudomonadota bacterium]
MVVANWVMASGFIRARFAITSRMEMEKFAAKIFSPALLSLFLSRLFTIALHNSKRDHMLAYNFTLQD